MGSFIIGMDHDKKDEGKLAKTTRDRWVTSVNDYSLKSK